MIPFVWDIRRDDKAYGQNTAQCFPGFAGTESGKQSLGGYRVFCQDDKHALELGKLAVVNQRGHT